MINPYLVLAYGFVLLIFLVYARSLSRRQAKLRKELEELEAKVHPKAPPDSRES